MRDLMMAFLLACLALAGACREVDSGPDGETLFVPRDAPDADTFYVGAAIGVYGEVEVGWDFVSCDPAQRCYLYGGEVDRTAWERCNPRLEIDPPGMLGTVEPGRISWGLRCAAPGEGPGLPPDTG